MRSLKPSPCPGSRQHSPGPIWGAHTPGLVLARIQIQGTEIYQLLAGSSYWEKKKQRGAAPGASRNNMADSPYPQLTHVDTLTLTQALQGTYTEGALTEHFKGPLSENCMRALIGWPYLTIAEDLTETSGDPYLSIAGASYLCTVGCTGSCSCPHHPHRCPHWHMRAPHSHPCSPHMLVLQSQ